jgi:uncharacterized membrane protein YphA (DoxX/SURF4 family)
MKYFIWILRIAVGLLFIFSGLVKANDPLGLTYKMNEFFEVWDMGYMLHYTLTLSVLMIAFEIIAGVAMIVGNSFRFYITLLVLLNLFYTFLTWYAWSTDKIKECGCFGTCIKISNSATFYKDVALSVMTIILYIFRYRVFPIFNRARVNILIMLLVTIFSFGIQWWALNYLPFYDCLPYKAGNNLWEKMQPAPDAKAPVYNTVLIYEKHGVKKEYTTENIPWKDPSWKFDTSITTLVTEGTGQPEIPHDFTFTDSNNTDQTQAILTAKGYTFLWFVRAPENIKMNSPEMMKLHGLIIKAHELHIPFYVLCSVGREDCNVYQEAWDMKDIPFMTLDGTVSKTAMRTDPGLMLLNNGVVVHKWSYKSYPKDFVLDNGVLNLK